MSKRCIKCEMEIRNNVAKQHDDNICSKNYIGSSKAMEPHGLLTNTLDLFENHCCILDTIVMDDDSSSANILQWDYEAAIKKGMLTKAPQTPAGRKKENVGRLPLEHPPWTHRADINHRLRCLIRKVYALAYMALGKSLVTPADAERLKRNVSYAVHEYKLCEFAVFKKAVWAVLYHHFGDHSTCGEWCPARKHKDDPAELAKLFYRDKIADKALYDQILKIWADYCSDDALRDIHHEWHTNKCESMNKFITKFIPKYMHLCMSIIGKGRTYMAVGLDSVGYDVYFRTLFDILGLDYDEKICGLSHQRLDSVKKYHQTYNNKSYVRKSRCKARAVKIRNNIRKAIQDKKKGYCYESGMAAPGAVPKEEKVGRNKSAQCKHCGKLGHSRRTHRDCGKSIFQEKRK
jgi:hypothetical protein